MSSTRTYPLLLLCWALLFLGMGLPVHSQDEGQSYKERSFDESRLQRYRSDPRFKYERAIPEPPPEKDKARIKRKRSEYTTPKISTPNAALGGVVKALFWILVIGGGAFLLFRILKVNMRGLVNKKSDEGKVVIDDALDVDDIESMELDDPIRLAIEQGMYRKATRLLYLKALRELQDRSFIQWKRNKTNRDYLREIKRNELKPIFQDITFIFEYIWYGEFTVDKDHFNSAYSSFLQFDQALRRIDEE